MTCKWQPTPFWVRILLFFTTWFNANFPPSTRHTDSSINDNFNSDSSQRQYLKRFRSYVPVRVRDCPCCTAFPTKVELSAVIIVIPWLSSHFNVASSLDTKFSQNTTYTRHFLQHLCTTSVTSNANLIPQLLRVAVDAASVRYWLLPRLQALPGQQFLLVTSSHSILKHKQITSTCEKNLSQLWRTHAPATLETTSSCCETDWAAAIVSSSGISPYSSITCSPPVVLCY